MSNSSAPEVYSPISNDDVGISSTGFIAQDISTVLPGAVTMYDTGMQATGNITISNGGSNSSNYYYHTGSTVTISSNGNVGIGTISGSGSAGTAMGGTYTIGNADVTQFNWKAPEEFIDAFPDYNRIEKMCKEYPGLAIAFEKFKTVYKLVKDDYDTTEDQRPKP